MGILKQTSTQLVLKQFPIYQWMSILVFVVISFSLVITIRIQEPDAGLWGDSLGIISFAPVVFIYLTHDYANIITWTFDKECGFLTVRSKQLFGTKVSEYSFDQISCVMLSEDFGRDGADQIELVLKDRRNIYLILNNHQLMKEAVQIISNFLDIPSKREKFSGFSDLN